MANPFIALVFGCLKEHGKESELWINVGENRADNKYHVYDIVPKK